MACWHTDKYGTVHKQAVPSQARVNCPALDTLRAYLLLVLLPPYPACQQGRAVCWGCSCPAHVHFVNVERANKMGGSGKWVGLWGCQEGLQWAGQLGSLPAALGGGQACRTCMVSAEVRHIFAGTYQRVAMMAASGGHCTARSRCGCLAAVHMKVLVKTLQQPSNHHGAMCCMAWT
jgi:hypothetical protein